MRFKKAHLTHAWFIIRFFKNMPAFIALYGQIISVNICYKWYIVAGNKLLRNAGYIIVEKSNSYIGCT